MPAAVIGSPRKGRLCKNRKGQVGRLRRSDHQQRLLTSCPFTLLPSILLRSHLRCNHHTVSGPVQSYHTHSSLVLQVTGAEASPVSIRSVIWPLHTAWSWARTRVPTWPRLFHLRAYDACTILWLKCKYEVRHHPLCAVDIIAWP